MSIGLLMQKQQQKARNFLKKIAKMPYSSDEGDDFERAWLLLAFTYIQVGGKNEVAQDLCDKCLSYNQSCSKAWEFKVRALCLSREKGGLGG